MGSNPSRGTKSYGGVSAAACVTVLKTDGTERYGDRHDHPSEGKHSR